MDVSQPILSVGELHRKGHDVVFGDETYLRAGTHTVPLQQVGNMTYLEAVVLPDDADGLKNVNEPDQQKWCLLEWACDPKS
eukprot:7208423-Heterocapsa_arctica.AAC.1